MWQCEQCVSLNNVDAVFQWKDAVDRDGLINVVEDDWHTPRSGGKTGERVQLPEKTRVSMATSLCEGQTKSWRCVRHDAGTNKS